MSAIILVVSALLATAYLGWGGRVVGGLFFASAALPFLGGGLWSLLGFTRRGLVATVGIAVLAWGILALGSGGFSLGNPPGAHLLSSLILFAALAMAAPGLLEGCHCAGMPAAASMGLAGALWSLLVAAPFFLVSWLGGLVAGFPEQVWAGWIVVMHPFSAACVAAGGLDGWRHETLYRGAEIGARYAYRYPSLTLYASVCIALLLAGGVAHWLRGTRQLRDGVDPMESLQRDE